MEERGILRAINSVINKIEIVAGSFLYHGGTWNKEPTKIALDYTLKYLEEIRVTYKGEAPVLEKVLEWLEVQFAIYLQNYMARSEPEAKKELLRILEEFQSKLLNAKVYKGSKIGLLHEIIRNLKLQQN